MFKVLDKEVVTKTVTRAVASFSAFLLAAMILMICTGCGLTARSLNTLQQTLPATPFSSPKSYSPVQTLRLSPDEKYLIQGQHITAKEGETFSGDILQIWNIEKKKHVLINRQRAGVNLAATFTPDCKYVISCGNSGVSKFCLQDETTQVVTLEEPKHISPDGTLVACNVNDSWVIRAIDSPKEEIVLPQEVDRFLAFSYDKKHIATSLKKDSNAGSGTAIAIWELEGENGPTFMYKISVPNFYASAERTRFSPNGKFVAFPSRQGGYVGIWDVGTGKLHQELGTHDGSIRVLEFSPDSKMLAVGTQEANGKHGRIYIWDVITGTSKEINENQAKGVTAVCFTANGDAIFFGNSSGDVKYRNIKIDKSALSLLSR